MTSEKVKEPRLIGRWLVPVGGILVILNLTNEAIRRTPPHWHDVAMVVLAVLGLVLVIRQANAKVKRP